MDTKEAFLRVTTVTIDRAARATAADEALSYCGVECCASGTPGSRAERHQNRKRSARAETVTGLQELCQNSVSAGKCSGPRASPAVLMSFSA